MFTQLLREKVMGQGKTLSVFFPAYLDEDNITHVVNDAIQVLNSLKKEADLEEYEIIVINDGSPDKTGEIIDSLPSKYPEVKIKPVHHEQNMGYGAALKTGFKNASYEYVFYSDGDYQFDLSELKKIYALIPFSDIVAGFRIEKKCSNFKKLTSLIYNLLLKYLFNIKGFAFIDVDCAFKVYKREIFDKITIESNDAFIDAEIIIKAIQYGYKTTEIGVSHLPRMDGRTTVGAARISIIIKTIGEIIKLKSQFKNHVFPQ